MQKPPGAEHLSARREAFVQADGVPEGKVTHGEPSPQSVDVKMKMTQLPTALKSVLGNLHARDLLHRNPCRLKSEVHDGTKCNGILLQKDAGLPDCNPG